MRTNRARLAMAMLAAAALLGGSALTMGVAPAGASTLGGTATIANPANNHPLGLGWLDDVVHRNAALRCRVRR